MKRLAILLALVASPLSAQSLTLTNLKGPIARICGVAPATSVAKLWAQIAACPSVTVPVPTPTPTPVPTPSPTPAFIETSKVAGTVPVVPSGLNIAQLVTETGEIASTGKPDVVGAFRFHCEPSHLSYDDPIVYPGQPGKAHLHQFFGNTKADGNSTYANLRSSGDSSCVNPTNRSSYWMPALLDGSQVVVPDNINIYYKRTPKASSACSTVGKACVNLPRGLRFIFGWDQTRPTAPVVNPAQFKCMTPELWDVTTWLPTMDQALAACKTGQKLAVMLHTSSCWDGVNLDTPDHRSHLSEVVRDWSTNYVAKCPATHQQIVAAFTLQAIYTILPGDNPAAWTFSSDHMLPAGAPRGSSFHADWFGAWEDSILDRWHAACIDKLLTCAAGNLGDGGFLKWPQAFSDELWKVGPRVPIPPRP